MLADTILHFAIECLGAMSLRVRRLVCPHPRGRGIAWLPLGLLAS